MIKKLTIAAGIVAVLILAAVLYFKREIGPSDAATLVPADVVAFVNLPNLPRTALRWQGTALSKISKEPDVKAFLEKPLGRLTSNPGSNEAGSLLMGLKPGNIFLAVTAVTPEKTEALIGFQYWGGRADFDKAVARLRAEIPGDAQSPAPETHAGTEILTTTQAGATISTATLGRWGFVGTSPDVVRAALDRVKGTVPAESALAASEAFKKVNAQLAASPDFLLFVQPGKAIDTLLAIGQSMGAQPIPAQVEELKATEAIGATWKIDGAIQRDALYALRKTTPPLPALTNKSATLTSPETMAFLSFFVKTAGIPAALAGLPAIAQNPAALPLATKASEAFGPEISVILDWPAGRSTPTALASIEVRDSAKADEVVTEFLAALPGQSSSTVNGVTLYSLGASPSPLASPTLARTPTFLLVGIDPDTVAAAATKPADSATLNASPAFAPVMESYKKANEVFVYVDTKMLFERAYTALRPVIIFGASVMPDISANIDPSKLPAADSITKHLSPMVLSQQVTEDGTLVESSGPITVNQAVLAGSVSAFLSSSALRPK